MCSYHIFSSYIDADFVPNTRTTKFVAIPLRTEWHRLVYPPRRSDNSFLQYVLASFLYKVRSEINQTASIHRTSVNILIINYKIDKNKFKNKTKQISPLFLMMSSAIATLNPFVTAISLMCFTLSTETRTFNGSLHNRWVILMVTNMAVQYDNRSTTFLSKYFRI